MRLFSRLYERWTKDHTILKLKIYRTVANQADMPTIGGEYINYAPLLFHIPGYGAEMSTHPDSVISGGKAGYKIWLTPCIMAITWAMKQAEVIKNRISFFGTSQGGGGLNEVKE